MSFIYIYIWQALTDLMPRKCSVVWFFIVFSVIVPLLVLFLPSFPNTHGPVWPDFGSRPPLLDILDFDFYYKLRLSKSQSPCPKDSTSHSFLMMNSKSVFRKLNNQHLSTQISSIQKQKCDHHHQELCSTPPTLRGLCSWVIKVFPFQRLSWAEIVMSHSVKLCVMGLSLGLLSRRDSLEAARFIKHLQWDFMGAFHLPWTNNKHTLCAQEQREFLHFCLMSVTTGD